VEFYPGTKCVATLAVCAGVLAIGATGTAAAESSKLSSSEKQLQALARGLRNSHSAAAYTKLSAFAEQRSVGTPGLRAALALGYFDYEKGRYVQAHRWLEQAKGDPLLREYAIYWSAQADRARGDHSSALEQLKLFRREFPQSVMAEQVLQALAETALELNQSQEALAALESEPGLSAKPGLLFLRGQAREQAGRSEEAAADYVTVYYRFPLSGPAREAGEKLRFFERVLGQKFPAIPLDLRISRARTLFGARQWHEAREAYSQLVPLTTGADREEAELREAQSRVSLSAEPPVLASLTLTDPAIDAERFCALSQAYRARREENEMVNAIESAASRAPSSSWAEQALFAGGNYFWVQLDLDRAAAYYRRLVDRFPSGKDAEAAHWRLAWVAYKEKRAEAPSLLEEHLRLHPGSAFTADALYWLGRSAERSGNLPLARAYFGKLTERFPQSYFGGLAASRLQGLGPGPAEFPGVLAMIPAPPPVAPLGEQAPVAAEPHWQRARALETIAFDASAELELRAAYSATGDARLLLEAAEAAVDAEHYSVAIVTTRLVYPQLESRRYQDVPEEVWHTAYPVPYAAEIRRAALRQGLDPMLVAGLVRQESAFQRDAASHAGAYGLMQLLPATARKLSRKLRLGYSQARLFDPEYNLRLGTAYFAGLQSSYGSEEAALAAYNAGEDRVALWQAGRSFDEPADFVESIPFTETREYVEIVIRNAAIYRRLYGGQR
jgi:soluble lytic murein transglycosylase